jgi:ribosomal protein L3 glutamine methyltransferase
MTLQELILTIQQQFEAAALHYGHGTDSPMNEAYALVFDSLGVSYDSDEAILFDQVEQDECGRVLALAKRRSEEHCPVPYLTNKAWFCGLPFYIDERALIPRSPLAEWIEKGLEPWLAPEKVTRILDLCTGSACIAIACAYAFPNAKVDAVDLSRDALAVADINVKEHQLDERVDLIESDVFEALGESQYDLIISNPPYVGHDEMQTLPKEYQHEPIELALEAENNGLAIVDRMIEKAKQFLSPKGMLVCEVGNTQEAMEKAYPDLPLTWLECEYGGHGIFLISQENL